ncbi:MAG TPA: 50S ribosomal protein L11 methyltransferase [Desulfosarcina sp.]|nr:50S ribosomal protein L11 methyltransferase [Desulfosarcina sp.]
MEWIEAKVDFDAATTVAAEELIADIFYDFGVKGVVVEDPTMEAPPGTDVILDENLLPGVNAVSGYFPALAFDQGQRQDFERAMKALSLRLNMRHRIFYRAVHEEDWAESWKAFFWPEKVSPRIVVKPTWREYHPVGDERVLEIDPGMAFGTGTHPTTALCLQMMEKYLRPDDRLLDVGTGSGILLAAAALLGASEVHGIDNDPVAVNVARQNLVLNAVPADRSLVWAGDLLKGVADRYDLVMANILAEVVIALLPDLAGILSPGGRFICSGILQSQQGAVTAEAGKQGLRVIETVIREEWVAMALVQDESGR